MNNIFETAYLKQLGLIKESTDNPKYYKIEIAIPDPNKVSEYITKTDSGLSVNQVNQFVKNDIKFMKKFNAKMIKPWNIQNTSSYDSGYIWSFTVSEWDLKDFLSYSFIGPATSSIIYNITYGEVYPRFIENMDIEDLVKMLNQHINTESDFHYFTIEETVDDIYETETVTSDPDEYYKLNN